MPSINCLSNTTQLARYCTFALLASSAMQPVAARAEEDDIVVTATRRDSTVQDTPIAITAITATSLANIGATNIADIEKLAPGLRLQDAGPGQRRISLRGILAAGEPTVGVYYDETPIAGNVGTGSDSGGRMPDFSLFDLERIEVLRGPQGTLFGASSMGGAIRILFAKPKQEYEASAEGSIMSTKGGGVSYFANGMINAPIVPDLLAARVVAYRRRIEGYIDNVQLGLKDVNDATVNGARLMLRLTPSPTFTLDGSALIEDTNANSYSWNLDVGRYKYRSYVRLPYKDRSRIYNGTARWDLGPATLTGVTSYQQRRFFYTSGDDTTVVVSRRNPTGCQQIFGGGAACDPTQLANFYAYMDSFIPVAFQTPGWTKDWTHELRLTSNGDHWLNWTIGAFKEDRKNYVDSQDARADLATGIVKQPEEIVYHRYVRDNYRQIAGFGEVSIKPVERVTLTAGVRYYDYKRTIRGETDVPWPVLNARLRPPYLVQNKQNGWLFKFNAQYDITSELMMYGMASQGTRPGGANQTIGLPDALVAYGADKLWNYELGLKTSLFNRRVNVNGAVFQIDWKNMQVSGTTPDGFYSYITNVGAARVRGAELEINAKVADGLTLFSNATYLDAKLDEDQINNYIVAAGRKGDRLPFIPHLTGLAGVEYSYPVSASLNFYARADANYVGRSYSELRPANPNRVTLNDYALANVRIGVEVPGGAWGAYLFVNNLTNSVAVGRASNTAFPNTKLATSATPRTIGLNVRAHF